MLKVKRLKLFLLVFVIIIASTNSGCKKKESELAVSYKTDLNEVNVGTSYIAEVTSIHCETFDGDTIDDISRPTNSYLPAGTVDYCSDSIIKHIESDKNYRLLRYGKRVYNGDVKVYKGSLPESNRLITEYVKTDMRHTKIAFQTEFKAPFTLELKEQEYKDEKSANYRIESPEFSYIEITFKYCNSFFDDLNFEGNVLFSHHEFIQNDDNAVLRLYLRSKGVFFGWYAEYDEDDLLVFSFLQPTTLYAANNEYGYTLSDAIMVIDAGHGGKDPGAVNGYNKEASFNLALANKLKTELEKIGVKVIMTRTNNDNITAVNRVTTADTVKPDMIISIHRDSGGGSGFHSYYYNPYSAKASERITKATNEYELYTTIHASSWHYFFLSRVPWCPTILTENGFISNPVDLENMSNEEHEIKCAKAITKGIIEYYLEMAMSV